MISEQHERIATSYYPLHDQIPILSNVAFGLRFYEFHNLISGHYPLVNGVFDIKIAGNLQYRFLFKPPAIDPDIEQDEADVVSISASHSLNLWPITLTEQDDFSCIGELLLKLLAGESMLEMLKQRGWHLRIISPASVVGRELILWLPKNPDVRSINFLVNHPSGDRPELWASIVPLDKRLPSFLY